MSNTFWAVILVTLLVAMTIYAAIYHRRTFLISATHNIVWAGAIMLVGSDLIHYKTSSMMAWLTLTAGLVAFNVGTWAIQWFEHTRRTPRLESTPTPTPTGIALVSRTGLIVLFALYGIGFGIYVANVSSRFGFMTLLTNPTSIRGFVGESYLASVPLAARILLYLGPVIFGLLGIKGASTQPIRLPWRILMMALLAVTMLAMLQRTNIIMAILLLLAALLSQRSRSRTAGAPAAPGSSDVGRFAKFRASRWGTPLVILAFVVTAGVSFQVVGGALGKTGQQALSTGAVTQQLADSKLTSPFVYYTGGTVAFLQLTDSKNHNWPPTHKDGVDTFGAFNPQTWGATTFAPVLKAIPGARPFPSIEPFIDVGISTNVFTWLDSFYRDFRLPGVIIAMLFSGLLIGGLYAKRFRSPRFFWLQAVLLSSVFLAPFVGKLNDTLFLTEIALVIALSLSWPRTLVRQSMAALTRARDNEKSISESR